MDLAIVCTIGVLLGIVIANVFHFRRTTFGTLRIDNTNPEKTIYRIDLDCQLDLVSRKKRVMLKIDNDADLSRK